MVRAWYHDNADGSDFEPHMTDPPKFVELEDLKKRTGIIYYKVNVDDLGHEKVLADIIKTHGYDYQDDVHCYKGMKDEQEIHDKFYKEHLHPDEEIRLITEGSGYFDVRDDKNDWIRIECEKGDMLILPGGIYHRFCLDAKKSIKANRYFTGVPVWTPYYRSEASTEGMDIRKKYLSSKEK